MPDASPSAVPEAPHVLTIRDLVSYRLARTASLMSRGAALRYKREFDVNLGEWRALALLAASVQPQSLIALSRAAGLDKAQMSRVVASLTERSLVHRAAMDGNGRSVALSLTSSGRRTYEGLIAAAAERDGAFRALFTPKELAMLEAALDRLAKRALGFIEAEAAEGS